MNLEIKILKNIGHNLSESLDYNKVKFLEYI
jgi:hypothetical protein